MNDLRGVIRYLIILLGTACFAACTAPSSESPPNRWADERLWPVLEAQEHRDTKALCDLLKHEAAEVREAAALAFASVQDTLGVPCLLGALRDEAAGVRATAVYALGFVADSLALEGMSALALNEQDTVVQRAYLSASFLALQRNGRIKDPNVVLNYLDMARGHEQARAADALRRLPEDQLGLLVDELRDRIPSASNDVRQFLVLALGRSGDRGQWPYLERLMVLDPDPAVQVNALRAFGKVVGPSFDTLALAMTAIHPLCYAAWDLLKEQPPLSGRSYLDPIGPELDAGLRIRLLGMAMKHGDAALADSVQAVLNAIVTTSKDPYQRAAAIDALVHAPMRNVAADVLLPIIHNGATSMERITAFRAAMRFYQDKTTGQVELILEAIDGTGDPGLISAVCEEIMAREKYRGFDVGFAKGLQLHVPGFQLPRDLEAKQLVDETVAYLNGLPPPAHRPPPFNHPINPIKLRALPQGQRYRITTTKGTIVIATDVNEAPGSSLAFDSLVTAGYYNGKAFHRMVPNFVVQGGCTRGDGYGGMPWTLRTEIGRKPFTAGSVGLASAGRDTENCQFFITHSATPHLDGRYTRFGEVVEGMDVVWRLQVGDVMETVARVE